MTNTKSNDKNQLLKVEYQYNSKTHKPVLVDLNKQQSEDGKPVFAMLNLRSLNTLGDTRFHEIIDDFDSLTQIKLFFYLVENMGWDNSVQVGTGIIAKELGVTRRRVNQLLETLTSKMRLLAVVEESAGSRPAKYLINPHVARVTNPSNKGHSLSKEIDGKWSKLFS